MPQSDPQSSSSTQQDSQQIEGGFFNEQPLNYLDQHLHQQPQHAAQTQFDIQNRLSSLRNKFQTQQPVTQEVEHQSSLPTYPYPEEYQQKEFQPTTQQTQPPIWPEHSQHHIPVQLPVHQFHENQQQNQSFTTTQPTFEQTPQASQSELQQSFSAQFAAQFPQQPVVKPAADISFAHLLPNPAFSTSFTPNDDEIRNIQFKTNTIGSLKQQIGVKSQISPSFQQNSFLNIRTNPLEHVNSFDMLNSKPEELLAQQTLTPAVTSAQAIAKKAPSAAQQKINQAAKKTTQQSPSQLKKSIQKGNNGAVLGADEFEQSVLAIIGFAMKKPE